MCKLIVITNGVRPAYSFDAYLSPLPEKGLQDPYQFLLWVRHCWFVLSPTIAIDHWLCPLLHR